MKSSLVVLLLLAGCGPQHPTSSAPLPAPSAIAEETQAPPSEPAPAPPPTPSAPPAGKRPPCNSDQSCNDDESISALWGKCTPLGVCECKPGFELNPRGRCQKPLK